jgi:GNAT superfamily N-acetyltransferase
VATQTGFLRLDGHHVAYATVGDGDLLVLPAWLACVDADHHVLVAHVDGDPRPAAMARLVRDARDPSAGEIAFEVADVYQGRGIGTRLVELLLADVRGAGITRINALVQTSNRAALSLLRHVVAAPLVRVEGAETVVAAGV